MTRPLPAGLLACLLAIPSALLVTHGRAAPAELPAADEGFHYHWQLRNLLGVVAGFFLPRQGDGELTFKVQKNGHLLCELLITSPDSGEGENFRYGSEIDARTLQPFRAWSSYTWHGRSKSQNDEIEQKGVIEIVSGIYALRRNPPVKPRRMEIWSDGKIYPVVVIPLGDESKLVGGRQIETRHYSIRPVDLPGRRRWKGKVDCWLARDAVVTPVEILISRSLADVRLELATGPAPATPAGGGPRR